MKFKLNELLQERNISPEELSNIIQIKGKVRVYEWLRDEGYPNFENIIKLADFFNCSIEYLFGRITIDDDKAFKQTPPFDVQLKKVMKEKNTSQYKMIKDKVVRSCNFGLWFKSKSKPNIDMLFKLADYFNISVDELVGRV